MTIISMIQRKMIDDGDDKVKRVEYNNDDIDMDLVTAIPFSFP